MTEARPYASPEAFKQALEARLKSQGPVNRLRQLLVMARHTMPRLRANMRVKDLPDIALLATTGPYDAGDLLEALSQSFGFRATPKLPGELPPPPADGLAAYARLAQEGQLPWATLAEVFAAASAFTNPVLSGGKGCWAQDACRW